MPNLVAVRRSCRKKGGYRQTDKGTLQLYIVDYPVQYNPIGAYYHYCVVDYCGSGLAGSRGHLSCGFLTVESEVLILLWSNTWTQVLTPLDGINHVSGLQTSTGVNA